MPNPNIGLEAKKGSLAAAAAKKARAANPKPPASEGSAALPKGDGLPPDQRTPPLATALGKGRLALSAEVYAQGWRFVFALLAEKRGARWLLNDEEAKAQGRLTKGVIDQYDWLQKTVGKIVEGHGELGLLVMGTFQIVGTRLAGDELERQLKSTASHGAHPGGRPAPPRPAAPAPAGPAGPAGVEFESPSAATAGPAFDDSIRATRPAAPSGGPNGASAPAGGGGRALPSAVVDQYESFYGQAAR